MTSSEPDIELVPTDRDKTKEELLTEIVELRQKIRMLEETGSFPRNEGERTQAANALMRFFATSTSRQDYLGGATQLIHLWTGCRYVGVRVLNQKGEIPYESYLGFSREFWESENWLSIHADQCVCIRVVTGRPEAQDLGLMTRGGSFFIDNSLAFVDSLTPAQRRRYRGACLRCGFKSIAVVPLVAAGKIAGVIHVADESAGKFDLNVVEFLEETGFFLGSGLEKFNGGGDPALHNYLRLLMERSRDGVSLLDLEGRFLDLNTAGCLMQRCNGPGVLAGTSFLSTVSSPPGPVAQALRQAAGGIEAGVEYRGADQLGRPLWWETTFMPVRRADGVPRAILAISRDISPRRQGE